MLEPGKPTVLLSTHEGLRLGEGKRTAAGKASQSPLSPRLVRNCRNQPVKDPTEGEIFWVTALEKKVGGRVCSPADRSRECNKTVWYSLRPPKVPVENGGASETDRHGSQSGIHHLRPLGKLFGFS